MFHRLVQRRVPRVAFHGSAEHIRIAECREENQRNHEALPDRARQAYSSKKRKWNLKNRSQSCCSTWRAHSAQRPAPSAYTGHFLRLPVGTWAVAFAQVKSVFLSKKSLPSTALERHLFDEPNSWCFIPNFHVFPAQRNRPTIFTFASQ